MKKEDLKIGDTIKVDGKSVKFYKRVEATIYNKDYYALIGKTKNNKRWSTDFIPVTKD